MLEDFIDEGITFPDSKIVTVETEWYPRHLSTDYIQGTRHKVISENNRMYYIQNYGWIGKGFFKAD